MPGPLLTVTISESARIGRRAGPLLILGHGLIELILVVALFIGLSRLLSHNLVAGSIGALGGSFLIWMGFSLTYDAWKDRIQLFGGSGQAARSHRPILTGILASIANPYWVLWWITVGASYIIWSLQHGLAGLISFYTGHILSDLGWYSLVAVIVVSSRKIINDTVYRGIFLACGLFLILLGLYFINFGLGFWLR
ncbi:MAG: LysE family translocator [Chloroflexi bacterium]|nr:LysE family translocator [Chloroflexota bacterium]MCL5075074.1 LysE family translocator [Chloroflexota bacterium]